MADGSNVGARLIGYPNAVASNSVRWDQDGQVGAGSTLQRVLLFRPLLWRGPGSAPVTPSPTALRSPRTGASQLSGSKICSSFHPGRLLTMSGTLFRSFSPVHLSPLSVWTPPPPGPPARLRAAFQAPGAAAPVARLGVRRLPGQDGLGIRERLGPGEGLRL